MCCPTRIVRQERYCTTTPHTHAKVSMTINSSPTTRKYVPNSCRNNARCFRLNNICAGLASAAPRDNWGGCVVETPSRRRRRRCVLLACCCAVLTQALNCVRTSHSSRPCQQPSFSEMAARGGPRTRRSPVMTKRNLPRAGKWRKDKWYVR